MSFKTSLPGTGGARRAAAPDPAAPPPVATDAPSPDRPSRYSTGAWLFIVLTIALAPLGAIASGAAFKTIVAGDAGSATLLNVAAERMAGAVGRQFDEDGARVTAIRDTLPKEPSVPQGHGVAPIAEPASPLAAPGDPPPAPTPGNAERARTECQAFAAAFPGGTARASVQIVDRMTGVDRCSPGVPAAQGAAGLADGTVRISGGERLLLGLPSDIADTQVQLSYPVAQITRLIESGPDLPEHKLELATQGAELTLRETSGWRMGWLWIRADAPVGKSGLLVRLMAERSWLDNASIITIVTPFVMWLIAAGISWLVVDRMLLAPIQRLSRTMAGYRAGDVLAPSPRRLLVAREVSHLDDQLVDLAGNVARDHQAIATALARQATLTREVHHRVKNNIQIISSLISLHSRDSTSEERTRAYRTIHRRVDALAVVQRHMFADGEGHDGIDLPQMVSELAVSLRNSLTIENAEIVVSVQTGPVRVVQDVALPAAFFVTELVELATLSARAPTIIVALTKVDADTIMLSVTSAAFEGAEADEEARTASYQRVLTGLARQLRRPLERDAAAGSYAIAIPIIGPGSVTAA